MPLAHLRKAEGMEVWGEFLALVSAEAQSVNLSIVSFLPKASGHLYGTRQL